MHSLSSFVGLIYQYADTVSFLILSAIGLIIIFGMMGVINLAHGEMMMVGAYTTSFAYYSGIPLIISVILGGLVTSVFGILLERLIIRRFYGQLLSSLVATWGLSLLLSQGALLAFGPQIKTVPTPMGSFSVGELSFSNYRVFLFIFSIFLIIGVWSIFNWTRFGLQARATMENPKMAKALGVNTHRIYALTFGLGAGLAGIAGGLFAGLIASAFSLAAVKTAFVFQYNILIGHVSMLIIAIISIRMMPEGISQWLEQRKS